MITQPTEQKQRALQLGFVVSTVLAAGIVIVALMLPRSAVTAQQHKVEDEVPVPALADPANPLTGEPR